MMRAHTCRLTPLLILALAGTLLAQPEIPERPDVGDVDRVIQGMQTTPLILLSSGEGEKSVLTLRTDAPTKRTIKMRSTLALLENRDAQQLTSARVPAAVFTVSLEGQPAPDAQDATDEIATTFSVTDADVDEQAPEGEEPYEQAMIDRARINVQSTAGAVIVAHRAPDGAVLNTTLVSGAPGLVQNTNTVTYWATLELRLPDTPVAPGARWRTLATPDSELPLHIDVVTNCALTAVTDDTFTIDFEQQYIGRPLDDDDMSNPIRAIISATEGTITVDRRLGVPIEGELVTGTWLTISTIRGGVAQILNQGASATTTITPVDE